MTPVGRFAPSPTGRMHLGNVYCALLSYLSVKSQGGKWILRIEDLDPDRSRPEFSNLIEDDLHWLGLYWDEGGTKGGPRGPYFQQRRTDIYAQVYQLLQSDIYPCFCSRADLLAASAPHAADGRAIYAGTCRDLSPQRVAQLQQCRKPAFRLKLNETDICFTDGHYGVQSARLPRDCGDFVVRRADGVFAYNLAVVADDHLMEVSQVVRGVDLLPVTPEQIYLYRRLGWKEPEYFHIPLLVDASGRRLCKRNKDLELGALRSAGIPPQRVLGDLGYWAGLLPERKPASLQDLLERFDWSMVPTGNVVVG